MQTYVGVNKVLQAVVAVFCITTAQAQDTQSETYCNPLNIDYTYAVYDAHKDISYRSGADPAVVEFRNEYYMFVTRSMGYWHSKDLQHWNFISPEKWYFQGSNAPAAFNYKDSVLYVAGDPSGSMSILYTDDPKKGNWKATPAILNDLQDPALFIDDDGQAYMYWGSSNTYPLRVKKLDKEHRFKPSEETVELFTLHGDKHGWERFGENHSDTVLAGYMEGAWMTKRRGKYYLQYAAPGTEFNVYGDGVYISDSPLGPFTYAPNNPVSYKPGGFMNGAGHGSTVEGPAGQYWHFGSATVSVNMNWERRISMFPTYFDKDGLMYMNTYFGDYPHYAPAVPGKMGEFTGWMLLSYQKPVKASSSLQGFKPENMVDENVKSFWVAAKNNDQQWVQVDLQSPGKVYAIQVNYHDYKSDLYGKVPGLHHRYLIEGSRDGETWQTLVDREDNYKDVPNDYVELATPQTVRYIRFQSLHAPTPNLAISGLRVFGHGLGKAPSRVKGVQVKRLADRRDALITWDKQPRAQGYNVLWGIAPDKLYNSWMVYGDHSLNLKSLSVDQAYYFAVEAFNESGVSDRTKTIKAE
ncbi:F5/8 type C domain-containing protein [Pontibacter ummariensis]|uniref:F5/8 type C domain-containing protein n=1 Tax=Pontibacter ummariensis TaxID=1610492 RepID=A0A239IR16_9BACT|nr:family 43 glycosylhydrolase [Pontibacter ummariensis]PRY09684.1 F5/8 type C domain-containing protein [Pontibacter ummariensis]SNS96080.1 F5/8 type C domain-containing protein [Pontibacter ummariensis]